MIIECVKTFWSQDILQDIILVNYWAAQCNSKTIQETTSLIELKFALDVVCPSRSLTCSNGLRLLEQWGFWSTRSSTSGSKCSQQCNTVECVE